jgi:hypothetical protein
VRRLVFVLLVGGLCGGCAAGWLGVAIEGRQAPARRLTRAQELTRDGQLRAARDLYEELVREPARDAVHASALYELARLYTDPSSGFLDYRAAETGFERFLAEYPHDRGAADARAWHATLLELRARQAEAAKLRAELQAGEKEVARLKDETTRLKTDRQRLKRIDLNFEHH